MRPHACPCTLTRMPAGVHAHMQGACGWPPPRRPDGSTATAGDDGTHPTAAAPARPPLAWEPRAPPLPAAAQRKTAPPVSDPQRYRAPPLPAAVERTTVPLVSDPQRYRVNSVLDPDTSPRCAQAGICEDGRARGGGGGAAAAQQPAGQTRGGEGAGGGAGGKGGGCGPLGLACVVSQEERRERVKGAMRWSWDSYRAKAWGHDELALKGASPFIDWMGGGVGLTIVDSLDTLLLMGMEQEYAAARAWVVSSLSFDNGPQGSQGRGTIPFEINIRVLGGLLSAFYLSGGDQGLLDKATDLGERLLSMMETPSGACGFEGSLKRPALAAMLGRQVQYMYSRCKCSSRHSLTSWSQRRRHSDSYHAATRQLPCCTPTHHTTHNDPIGPRLRRLGRSAWR
jgi:hypothetical protein